MTNEQKASNLAVQVITSALRPSAHEILLASLVKAYSTHHPEEFMKAVEEIKKKIEHQKGSKSEDSSEFYGDLVIRARGVAWEIMGSLDRAGALPEEYSALYHIVRVNPRLSTIPDESMRIIAEQTFNGYMNSKTGDK